MQAEAARFVDDSLVPLRGMLNDLVLVGGACIGLWIDSPAAPPARPTNDIDLVVMCRSRVEYHALAVRLRARGLSEDMTGGIICRWQSDHGAVIDIMPIDPSILGFSNPWYEGAFTEAVPISLPSGTVVRAASPPYLLACKFTAFDSPSRINGGDYLASADMNDIIALIDGRSPLLEECAAAPAAVRFAVAERLSALSSRQSEDAILNYVPGDGTGRQRSERIRQRIAALIDLR